MNQSEWLKSVVESKYRTNASEQRELIKEALGNTRQDLTRPILEDLSRQGYQVVIWDAGNSTHGVCRELDKQQWTLEDFLTGLSHDAPMFERSHPGDTNCSIFVQGQDLPTVRVDSFGNIAEV